MNKLHTHINDQRIQSCNMLYGSGVCKEILGHDGPTVVEIADWKETWKDSNVTNFGFLGSAWRIRKFARDQDIGTLHYQVLSHNKVAFYYEEDLILYKLLAT